MLLLLYFVKNFSNTYGVNIVEVNGGEKNLPTAVAVPVAG